MKYIAIFLMSFSCITQACVTGPKDITNAIEAGFLVSSEKDAYCDTCIGISAEAPLIYEGSPFSYALISVYLNSKIVFKGAISPDSNSQKKEFYSIVNNELGVSYELVFLYGSSRCSSFQYTYKSGQRGT